MPFFDFFGKACSINPAADLYRPHDTVSVRCVSQCNLKNATADTLEDAGSAARLLDRLLKLPDGVEGLANFAEPPGEFGTVERTNEDDGLMKWDDDGRMRLRRLMPSPQVHRCPQWHHYGPSKSIGNYRHSRIAARDPFDVALFVHGLAVFISPQIGI
jgi:hypothetical protein